MLVSRPFEIDAWGAGAQPQDPPRRDTAGEYLAMAFLSDGTLGIVSPIQNSKANRFGFSLWKVRLP